MGKRSAQAGNEEKAGGVRDQSRMAATRCHEARGNAREPDGGTPGRGLEYSLNSEYCFYAEYSA